MEKPVLLTEKHCEILANDLSQVVHYLTMQTDYIEMLPTRMASVQEKLMRYDRLMNALENWYEINQKMCQLVGGTAVKLYECTNKRELEGFGLTFIAENDKKENDHE